MDQSTNGEVFSLHVPIERILVFPSARLWGFPRFSGFRTDAPEMAERLLRPPLMFHDRTDVLEQNEDFKQVVAVVVPWHPGTRRVWCFKRGGSEGRLDGLVSCLVGGHVSEVDRLTTGQPDPLDMTWAAAIREMGEEVGDWPGNWRTLQSDVRLTLIGVVNHEGDAVGRVHFGIVYRLDVTKVVIPLGFARAAGADAGWVDVKMIAMDCFDGGTVEPWSIAVARHLAEVYSPARC